MTKKILNFLFLFLGFTFFTLSFTNKVNATNVKIFDDANILTNTEQLDIKNTTEMIDDYSYYYVIITTNESSNNYINKEDYFFRNFIKTKNISDQDNIIGLVINMNCRRYDMFTYGDTYEHFSNSNIKKVITKLEKPMHKQDYHGAIVTFIEETNKINQNSNKKSISLLIIPIAISFVIALITVIIIFFRYKLHSDNIAYPLNQFAHINFTNSRDLLIDTKVNRILRSTDSSNSGSSFHGSSGGGHRGGGSF